MSQESKTAAIPFGARVRKSPFFDSTRKDGAKAFSVYNHMYFPTSYAGTESEYDSLINDVTMWDVAVERQIEINGPDAYEFIRRLTPRNLEKCEIGRCLYVILTGHNGGAINDAVLLRLKPDQFWLSPGDGDVLLWIQGVAINSGFDVNVFEPDVSPLGICGPKAPALINKLFDGEHDDLRFYQARETSLAGIPMVIARTGWSGEISYELYLRDGKRGDALWAVVKDAGQEFNIAPAAPNTIRSIEGGLLSYVSDITRNDCPYTIGLDRLVDVDQDIDFIGKEALKKIKENGPARKLVGIEIAGDPITSAPEQPWPVFSGDENVGHVSRCIFSPRLGKNIGFANVPTELSALDTQLTIKCFLGDLTATVSAFPWVPAERIARHIAPPLAKTNPFGSLLMRASPCNRDKQMSNNKFDAFTITAANYEALTPLSFLPRTALMFPNRRAVVYGERSYSWQEFYKRCTKLASALNKIGIGRGDTVAVLAANTPEMVEAHFGIPMSGAVLNTVNTRLDDETIGYILRHGEAKVFIVDYELAPQVKNALEIHGDSDLLVIDILDLQNTVNPAAIGTTDYEAFLATGTDKFHWDMPTNEWDTIGLSYTSGTSGRPKGVVYHHRGSYLMSMGTITDWDLPRHPNYLYTVPMFHCNGWGHAWTMTALAGTMFCTRAIVPEAIFSAILEHNISHFGGAPIVLSMLLNSPAAKDFSCPHRVELMTAGAPPPASVVQGIENLGFNVTQVYGLTETYGHTVMCTWNSDWDNLDEEARAKLKARQGAAMVQTAGMRIVDMESREDVPADGQTIGEILIRGNTVMKGYLKDADNTAASFKNGWFHTGDLAVMHPQGYAEIKDRLKDIIISGGENISSVEIESVLHRHEAVALAAVVALPDEKWGEVPLAFIELLNGAQVTEKELEVFCRAHLASFKRPKKVIFGELPKTATGKIQKYELRALARSGQLN